MTNEQILLCVNYIKNNDKNSDIEDFYEEYLNGEASYEAIVECLKMIFTDWKEDMIVNELTKEEEYILSLFK